MDAVVKGLKQFDSSESAARQLRRDTILMLQRSKTSHIGSCLSMADALAVLYRDVLKLDPLDPNWLERDIYLQSKGHAAAILYACLARYGYLDAAELGRFCQDGARLGGHVTTHSAAGVEFSVGSLGHALPVGAGVALSAKRKAQTRRVFVMLSDGECDEGSNWEAALFAGHHGLDNLCVVVDYNRIQSFGSVEDVLRLEPLAAKWRDFGWDSVEIDGHDHNALHAAFSGVGKEPKPLCIIARTVKGHGVSRMENELLWHYRSPTKEEAEAALDELGGRSCETDLWTL
jgi:transketolase